LENPALFSGKIYDLDEIALEYLDLTSKYKGASTSCIRAHLFKILYVGLQQHIDLRERLAKSNPEDFFPIVTELRGRRLGVKPEAKLGWYFRHWKNTEVVKDGVKIAAIATNG
jgi:tRNA-dihydrouridine synthase 1